MSYYIEVENPPPQVWISYASGPEAIVIYLLSAFILIITLYGSVQTFHFYGRGDINSRFPLLLLFNALCILFFALFAIIGVASGMNQYALNVILIACGGIAFTIQLLRAVRLLFTIEVRYFITKQFANQFAFGDAEVDMLLYDDPYFENSESSERSSQEGSLAYDEDDDDYDDEYYEESLQYSASYFDYRERDAEFGNYFEDEDGMFDHSHGSLPPNKNGLPTQPGGGVIGPNGVAIGAPGDSINPAGAANSLNTNSTGGSLFSATSELSAELENEDDMGNSLGRWIFQHKSLATAPFMTGLSIFLFCKFLILTILFTTAPGLQWAYILWLVKLSLGVISCLLTISALKMVRIRSFYIYERTLQDYSDKYFPRPDEDLENADGINPDQQHLTGEENEEPGQISSVQKSNTRPSSAKGSNTRHKASRAEGSSSRGHHGTRTGHIRSESESSENIGSKMGTGLSSRHGAGGHSKMSKMDSSRTGLKRNQNGTQFINAADASGAISIFGAKIAQTNRADLDKQKAAVISSRKPPTRAAQQQQQQQSSTTGRSTTSIISGAKASGSTGNVLAVDQLDVQARIELEPDPNRPPPPQPPPTTLFTSLGDPSGQMLELLASALITLACYSIGLLIAIIYAAEHEYSQYAYFTLTPTKFSPPFTRGILILCLIANAVIVYSSLVHILVADYLKAIKWAILGGKPRVDVAQADMDDLDSLKKILTDNAARDEFRKFLDGEFSAENLLFWNAIEEYRSRPTAHFQSRTDTISSAKYIFSTYLAPGGVYEVNISSQCREKISTRLKVLLEDDPILPIRKFENNEVAEALEQWAQKGTLYNTFIWNENLSDGLKIRDFGDVDQETQLPKGARAIASHVVQSFGKQINDTRRPELATNPYPNNLFEQYCLIQIRDLYESILRSSQQHTDGLKPKNNIFDPAHSKLSKQQPQQHHDYASRHADYASRHGGHHGGQINQINDDPLANPPQLPNYTVQNGQNSSKIDRFNGILSLLDQTDDKNGTDDLNTTQGRRLRLQQQQFERATVQILQDEGENDDDKDEESSSDNQNEDYSDNNSEIHSNGDESDENQRINVAEWSYTRSQRDIVPVLPKDVLKDPKSIENNIPAGWTIYDLIKHKHGQQQRFKTKYGNAIDITTSFDNDDGDMILSPYANPPDFPGGPRRRGRGGRGRPNAQQGLELEGGQKLHHALMSYQWKTEACRRRLKHYTDIVDELVLVFDAAQLEIFKLMERDSFARFVKTPDFQQFVLQRNALKAQQEE